MKNPVKSSKVFYQKKIVSELMEAENVCKEVKAWLLTFALEKMLFPVDLLLREFINNAIFHGNLSDKTKKVDIKLTITKTRLTIKICDEGAGFDWKKKLHQIIDPTKTSGRGLFIGVEYCERIQFNRTGNGVRLWLKKGS